jgi:putative flippase GtrA
MVSVVSAGIAQAALAVAFGLWRWPIVASVFFSLGVSIVPAFILSDLVIWRKEGDRGEVKRRAVAFTVIAAVGSGISVVIVWFAVRAASHFSLSHAQLTLVANLSSVGSSGLVWIARYFVLDRYVFNKPANAVQGATRR